MNSNKNTSKRKSTDNENLNSRNPNIESDFKKNNDSISDSDLDIDVELDPEQSEASRYNDEEFLNSKHVNKHDQPTEQRELSDEEKASLRDKNDKNKNRIVN
ncbi:MAG: hypothetical protein ITF98_04460 [Fermentimonas sp.]|nr:hypothetical protein [Fermentimonas sp.]